MLNQFSRTELLIGKEAVENLKNTKVAVFGIGGVGSFVVEGLVRAGVENFILVDVAKARILEINPNAKVEIYKEFFMPDSKEIIDKNVDYIVDCVDTVTAKIELVVRAKKLNIPIISSMGTGNKLDPTKFEVTDIYKTSVCPLAKVMRKELRVRGIDKLKVVYSKEEPIKLEENIESSCKNECICPPDTKRKCSIKNQVPGSISFVPSVAGLIIAGEVIKDIIKK